MKIVWSSTIYFCTRCVVTFCSGMFGSCVTRNNKYTIIVKSLLRGTIAVTPGLSNYVNSELADSEHPTGFNYSHSIETKFCHLTEHLNSLCEQALLFRKDVGKLVHDEQNLQLCTSSIMSKWYRLWRTSRGNCGPTNPSIYSLSYMRVVRDQG